MSITEVRSAIGSSPLGEADKVWITFGLIFAVLFFLDNGQAHSSLDFTVSALVSTGPFIAAAILISAYAKGAGADRAIARVFSSRIALSILVAAVFGGLSPFCSCGVIPIIAALLSMGVPLAPVMAFWLASPLMDPSMFLLTSSIIGPEFALAKTVTAIGLGVFGGFATHWLHASEWYGTPLRDDADNGGCDGASVRSGKSVQWWFWDDEGQRAKFFKELWKVSGFLVKWLSLAFLLESIMLAYIDPNAVAGIVGGTGLGPILISTVIGVPAYLNGHAATPLVAGLMEQGMGHGAALAFLVSGGVTSIPASMAVFALVRRGIFALYLGFAFIGSIGAGLIYSLV